MKNKLFLNYYLILLLGIIFFIEKGNSHASVYTFFPTDDAYVTQSVPNSRNGLGRYLYATTYIKPSQQIIEHIYFKFYLGGIPENEAVYSATLNLYPIYNKNSWVNLNHIFDDSWNESEVSWNNRPDFGNIGHLLSEEYFTNIGSWLSLDLMATGEWDYQADQEDSFLSIMISLTAQSQSTAVFCSKEHFAPYMPYLFVSTLNNPIIEPVPIPSTGCLFLPCLVVIAMIRKVKK